MFTVRSCSKRCTMTTTTYGRCFRGAILDTLAKSTYSVERSTSRTSYNSLGLVKHSQAMMLPPVSTMQNLFFTKYWCQSSLSLLSGTTRRLKLFDNTSSFTNSRILSSSFSSLVIAPSHTSSQSASSILSSASALFCRANNKMNNARQDSRMMISTLKRRRMKMNKHKLKKRRKKARRKSH